MSVFLSVHVGMTVSVGVCVRVRVQMRPCISDDRFPACKGTIDLKNGELIARRVFEHFFEYWLGMGWMSECLSCRMDVSNCVRVCLPACACMNV